jgi:hypothetical protein
VRSKKGFKIIIYLGLLIGIAIGIVVLIPCGVNNESTQFIFEKNEAFCLGDNDGGKGEGITIGEYMIYAASIGQTSTKDYGSDVWTTTVQDDEGNDISFETYMEQEIINQIRTTHMLNIKAEEYELSLSEEELREISEDAQSYYDTLSSYDIGKVGIDLSLILNIYKENALAQRVYSAITSEAILEEDMTEEEYNVAKLHYFDRIYEKIKDKSCEDWSYDIYVNKKALDELSLASLYNETEDSSDRDSSNTDVDTDETENIVNTDK